MHEGCPSAFHSGSSITQRRYAFACCCLGGDFLGLRIFSAIILAVMPCCCFEFLRSRSWHAPCLFNVENRRLKNVLMNVIQEACFRLFCPKRCSCSHAFINCTGAQAFQYAHLDSNYWGACFFRLERPQAQTNRCWEDAQE